MSSYVVEFKHVREGAMYFDVYEERRPMTRARFVVTVAELVSAADPGVIMSVRTKTALDQVRSR